MQIISLRPIVEFWPLISNIPTKMNFELGVGGPAVVTGLVDLQLQPLLFCFWCNFLIQLKKKEMYPGR